MKNFQVKFWTRFRVSQMLEMLVFGTKMTLQKNRNGCFPKTLRKSLEALKESFFKMFSIFSKICSQFLGDRYFRYWNLALNWKSSNLEACFKIHGKALGNSWNIMFEYLIDPMWNLHYKPYICRNLINWSSPLTCYPPIRNISQLMS